MVDGDAEVGNANAPRLRGFVTRVGIEPTTNGLKELPVTTRILATMQ